MIRNQSVADNVKTIGVISDTHGLLRPEAFEALQGVDLIFHTGDIGGPDVLEALEQIAPLQVVRGNCDGSGWSSDLPVSQLINVNGFHFYLLHNLGMLDLDLESAGVSAVISGHSHQPKISKVENVLFVNPGSAGPRRFDYPVSVAKLTLQDGAIHPELIMLNISKD
ncbi:MAG: metallophosphoesterase family protein [Proteobacteria bacterium]|nr:metallophosphoesterase family protein [Pseudomonadota bacterium]